METQSIVLPNSEIDTIMTITDIDGDSETKPIVITASNGSLIEGNSSYTINKNNDIVTFKFDGTQWNIV